MEYQQCKRCVMDTTTNFIQFDAEGICNYCKDYEELLNQKVYSKTNEIRKAELNKLLSQIKDDGRNNQFDCILGISGGMDSSYLCILAKEWGLRPLVVHFDNGWNSDLAVTNIRSILDKLNFSLYTHVINWEQFKNLQLAYFKASVLDIEVPNDQLIFAALFKVAKDKNIKHIISGNNIYTEAILPSDWAFHQKFDLTNLKNINDKFGTSSLEGFPTLSLKDRLKYKRDGFQIHTVFEYVDYDYNKIKKRLEEEFNYIFYECKHFESVFTRFYQGYILPKKWNIDKRKAHYSCLIMAGSMKREDAIVALGKPTYDLKKQNEDLEYVIKKWGITREVFDNVMATKPVSHDVYGYDSVSAWDKLKERLFLIYKYQFLRRLGLVKEKH